MTVNKEIKTMEILVSANIGVKSNGAPMQKDFAFKNINPNSTNEVLYKHGMALGTLIKHTKSGIYIRERHLLSEVQA